MYEFSSISSCKKADHIVNCEWVMTVVTLKLTLWLDTSHALSIKEQTKHRKATKSLLIELVQDYQYMLAIKPYDHELYWLKIRKESQKNHLCLFDGKRFLQKLF